MGNGEPVPSKFLTQLEINHVLTILYTLVEVGRQQVKPNEEPLIRNAFGMVLEAFKLVFANICIQRKQTVTCFIV